MRKLSIWFFYFKGHTIFFLCVTELHVCLTGHPLLLPYLNAQLKLVTKFLFLVYLKEETKEAVPLPLPCPTSVTHYQKLCSTCFCIVSLTFILWLLFPFVPATAGNGKFVFWASVFLCPGIFKHLFFYEPKIPVKMLSGRSSSHGSLSPFETVPLNEAPRVHFLKFISLCYQ